MSASRERPSLSPAPPGAEVPLSKPASWVSTASGVLVRLFPTVVPSVSLTGARARVARVPAMVRRLPFESPWLVIAMVLLLQVPALWLASGLEVRSSFRELLPERKASVVELDRLGTRMGGGGTLIVLAQGGDGPELRRFVEALSARIRGFGPRWVTGVDDGARHWKQFVRSHWWVYARDGDLQSLRDDLVEARDREVLRRAGLDLELDDEASELSPTGRLQAAMDRFAEPRVATWADGMPDYYVDDHARLGAVVVRTPFATGDDRVRDLEARIREVVAGAEAESGVAGLVVNFTGSLVTSVEEHRAVVGDLTHVGIVGTGLVLGVVFLYFLRLRALLAMGLTIACGCSWSFAVARLSVGYLNSASGFLVSIIAGNGINFGILLMARYLDGRCDEHLPPDRAIACACRDTWKGTLTAAIAAALAYGSLAITGFPGFRQFGIIGAAGMLCCWTATYLLMPAILMASERVCPIIPEDADWRRQSQRLFAGPLYALAHRGPRSVAMAGSALCLVCAVAGAVWFFRDPMEYDLTRIRNDAADPGSARALGRTAASVVGAFGRDGRAIVVDRLEDVAPLVQELERRRDAAPPELRPFSRVVSIRNLLPERQEARVAVANELIGLVRNARRRHLVDDATWSRIEGMVPDKAHPVDLATLPEEIVWPFTESDGSRGRIIYLVPAEGRSLNDARYLSIWADSYRAVELPDGRVVHGSGDPVVFADVLSSIRKEAPVAVGVSLFGTAAVVLAAFMLRRTGWLALATLLAGFSMLIGFLAFAGIRINFLSFMALPITIGVGADYAVNVLRRHEADGEGSERIAFVQTGGAVVLCSLTTILGYGALLRSINGAVRSFGLAAAVGEVVMILSATVLLPSIVLWRAGRRAVAREVESQ